MKTTDQLKWKIKATENALAETLDKKEAKKLNEELTFQKNCLQYLEFNPNKEFLEKQLSNITNKIDLLNDNYGTWLNSTPGAKQLKSPKSQFNKETGISGMKKQVETLNFLLS